MFENLRNAFREAADNFHRELGREGVSDTVDGLLKGMEREAVAARSGLKSLREQADRARTRAEAEAREVEGCRRREELARQIGDEATEEVAATFAEKHERRKRVFSDKAKAIEAETQLLESEYREMIEQIKKARANRDSLAATAGRAGARETFNRTDDLFGELDRMADRMEGGEGSAGRADDIFDRDRELDESVRRARRERVADARLEELKRRMGRK